MCRSQDLQGHQRSESEAALSQLIECADFTDLQSRMLICPFGCLSCRVGTWH